MDKPGLFINLDKGRCPKKNEIYGNFSQVSDPPPPPLLGTPISQKKSVVYFAF